VYDGSTECLCVCVFVCLRGSKDIRRVCERFGKGRQETECSV